MWLILVLSLSLVSGYSDLNGSNVRCREEEGEEVHVPGITNINPCYTCRCLNRIVQCEDARRKCPSTSGCYNLEKKLPGQCCEKCQGCVINGTLIGSGKSWTDPLNPCSQLTCFSGVLTEEKIHCDAHCSSPTPPGPGECCPSCSSCRLHGLSLMDGEIAPDPADPCRECHCDQGNIICQRKSCPVLSCPTHLQTTPPGHCCPQCPRGRFMFTPRDMCLFQSNLYRREEVFQPDTCTSCTCSKDLVPTCSRSGCLPAHTPPSCTHSGAEHPHDTTWSSDDCKTCKCNKGVVECTRSECPSCPPGTQPSPQPGECCPACRKIPKPAEKEGVCTVFGDPHYKTFDGRIYNFQGSCKYLLTRDCSEGSGNSNFSIRITNDARDTVAFSWLRTVTVRLGDTKVSLLQRMRVKVDGKKVSLPYIKLGVLSVMQDGYRVILRTNEGARILWDGVSFLELTVPARMAGLMCGLCGNFNGDRSDDLIGRHGSLLSSGQEFGNSWRVGGKKACSVLPRDVPAQPPPCKQNWDANIRSSKHCAAIKSLVFQPCHARIHPEFYFKACRIDMCECPGSQCHCEVLTAYARECERAGVRIPGWREPTGCRNMIPFKYSGEHFYSGEMSSTSQANSTRNEVLNLEGGEVFDDDLDALDLSQIGMSLPANRVEPEIKIPKKKNRKRQMRRLRRLERKRERELKRKQKKEEEDGSKKSLVGLRNRMVVKRVEGDKKKLDWGGSREQARPPFEFLLHAEEDERQSREVEYSDEDQIDKTELSSFQLKMHNIDYSELPNSKGRTPIPLMESDFSERSAEAADIHRKNWKRRRSIN